MMARCDFICDQNECLQIFGDRAERHDLKSRPWFFFSPFIFPPKQRGKKKKRMNTKNCDFKSCLFARSFSVKPCQFQAIQLGDELIEVNAKNIKGLKINEAIPLLKSAGKVVKLKLSR